MFNKLRRQLSQKIVPILNGMTLPSQFLRYGNHPQMSAAWSDVEISDKDLYSGYLYAAIRNRAVTVARIATEQVTTEGKTEDAEHPYLPLIQKSEYFSEYAFWSTISTFLDLEGVFYLMAIRATQENTAGVTTRTGKIKYFKLLNPYNIHRVLDANNLEVEGYIENRKGFSREIPKDMIIEIRELNPFSEDIPFAMTDAAKDSQFTLKTTGDYTRHVIRNNINAPGILSTDIILDDQTFANFQERVRNHTKGEPLFANGTGAITWEGMTTDLSKAALKDTGEINRDQLFAVAGVSKTIMGIEQSGTTRDTARVQKDLNVEGQILPRIQLVLDALNLDYRNKYPKEYAANETRMEVINPQESDHDSDLTAVQAQTGQFDLYQTMLDKGYSPKVASAYIMGEIELEKVGKPKKQDAAVGTPALDAEGKPMMNPDGTPKMTPPASQGLKKKENKLELDPQSIIDTQQAMLKNSVMHIEKQLVMAAINRVEKNKYENDDEVVSKKEKKYLVDELALVLATFYTVIFQTKSPETMATRIAKFGLSATFTIDRQIQSYVKMMSTKVAESHIQTVTSEVLQTARESALAGLSQTEIVNKIKQEYTDTISTTRAETIARTETNRAFTQAQYQADKQFIIQNDLQGRAYKRWVTRSNNPCAFCESLAHEGLIPFDTNFRDLGEDVVVGTGKDQKTLNISFESLEAGNAHPNCSCIYELVIQ